MIKKALALFTAILCFSLSSIAGDIIRIDLNFRGSDGTIVSESELPDGVRVGKKFRFLNKKIYGFATPIYVDLGKVQEIDLSLKIKGGKPGVLTPSIIVHRASRNVKRSLVRCRFFEFCGKTFPRKDFTFSKWTSVNGKEKHNKQDGDTITIKAAFKSLKK